ncbi:MAG: archaeosortase/exosortase family protein [Planctomycetes bacterium]|nr:archaeosortase/exosortase family protein [Planctomycetota bacterium]
MSRTGWIIATTAAAYWPAWIWYGGRMVQFSEQRVGLAALAIALAMAVRDHRQPGKAAEPDRERRVLWAVGGWTALYALTFPFVPALVRNAFALGSIAVLIPICGGPRRASAGVWALLLLATPAIPSLQFYCGFPLRLVAAWIAEQALAVTPLEVERVGVSLRLGERIVLVDAPCSGVRMLWSILLVAASIAAWLRLPPLQTALLGAASVAGVVLANAVRTTALFFPEAGLVSLPSWGHSAIGVITFTAAAAFLVTLSHRIFGGRRWQRVSFGL